MKGIKYGNSLKTPHIPRTLVTVHVTDGNALGLPEPDPVLTLLFSSSVTEQAEIIVARFLEDRDRRKKIMMTIGDSLNEVWSDDKWLNLKLKRVKLFFLNSNGCIVYCDVVCANDFRNKGPIQQDGHSCGIIWMMIVWFIVTEGRAPNADECRNSLCFQRKIWMMIVWFFVTEGRAPNADECRTSLCFHWKI